MLKTLCSFLFGVALIFMIILDKGYAKDYRLDSNSYRYSGKIKTAAAVKEKPWLSSKTIATLRPGDMVSVVSQQGDFYAIRVKQKPEKNIWVKKNTIQLYKKKDLAQQKKSPTPAPLKQKVYQNPRASVNEKKNNYYIGLAHYKNIKQFSANQTGVSAFYERRIKQSGLCLNADFLYNDLFNTYSISPGYKYHFSPKNNYHLSSALYVGYEKLFDETRSINAIISHLELLQVSYKYQSVNMILSPLQLRVMLSADQKIPVNFRYGISLGVQF